MVLIPAARASSFFHISPFIASSVLTRNIEPGLGQVSTSGQKSSQLRFDDQPLRQVVAVQLHQVGRLTWSQRDSQRLVLPGQRAGPRSAARQSPE
jgi:hypothetical protein